MSDILNVFGVEYTGVNGIRAYDPSGVLKTYIRPSGSQAITQNNTYDVSALAQVVVNVESSSGTYQDKTGIAPSMSSQTIVPDDGYDALSSVQINAMPAGSATTPATTITANPTISVNSTTGVITASVTGSKTIIPTVSAGYVSSGTSGTVSVSGSNTSNLSVQAAKTVTPTETEQTAVAAGKYTTGDVKVAAISSTYVGSGITGRSSTDLTASGATVTVPAGYYSAQATKSVATATHPKPTVSVNTTNGLITATHTQTAGYVSAGTTTETSQLSVQAAATITPTEEEQTAVAAGKYTTGAVKVAAISSTYIGSDITQRNDTDLTVSGGTVTVPAGYYAEDTSKSVTSGSATTPATSVTANPTISVSSSGLITATASATKSVTPTVSAGYVSSGTAGTITVSGSNTSQLSTQAAVTATPSEEEQTIVAAGKYTTGAIKVAAIPDNYVGSSITVDPTPTASGATVTIPEGYYSEATSKSVATTTHPDPTVSVNTTTGLITATHAQTAGYVSAGTTTGTYQLSLQSAKTVTPTETEQTAVAAGKYTTGAVKVAAVSSTYVGSGITQRDETDLSASGATVTVPAGYYAEQETKSVATVTQASPTVSVNTTTGLITATHTQSAGYVAAGTKTGTSQLSTQAAATITPTKSEQTAVAANKYTTGIVKVAAIPSDYIVPTGTKSITSNGANIDVAAYASVDVSVPIGASGGYTRVNRVPSQTVACTTLLQNQAYYGFFQSTSNFERGSHYVVTFDGNEYVCVGYQPEANCTGVGDIRVTATNAVQYLETPFFFENDTNDGKNYFVVRGSGTHTVQVDEIVLIDGGTTLTSKTITSNGTYDPADDNADGYSEVTVNVQSALPSLQAKTNITPTKSSQTITPDNGYDGLSSVQINAIPAAYQDVTGVTAAAGDVVSGKTIVSSTGATVNGSLVIQHYYTGSTAPSSSLGANGDIYLQA